jgi:hypothetical protein
MQGLVMMFGLIIVSTATFAYVEAACLSDSELSAMSMNGLVGMYAAMWESCIAIDMEMQELAVPVFGSMAATWLMGGPMGMLAIPTWEPANTFIAMPLAEELAGDGLVCRCALGVAVANGTAAPGISTKPHVRSFGGRMVGTVL